MRFNDVVNRFEMETSTTVIQIWKGLCYHITGKSYDPNKDRQMKCIPEN